MSAVRIAIVGAGVIGQRHAAAIASCKNIDLMGYADPSSTALETAKSADVPLFDNIAELMASDRPDGIIIATPTEAHIEPALATLEAGIPVLIEKPITATLEEAKQVVSASSQACVPVLVAHQRRYYGLVQKARDMVREGALGQLVTVSGQWNMRKNASYYDPDWRKQWKAGPILTNLIHEIDLLRHICGEVASINAETSNAVLGFEKEDAAALILRFENGALGTFLLSDQATSPWSWELALGENAAFPPTGQNSTRFMGTKAALDFPNLTLWHHGDQTPAWNHAMESEDHSLPVEDAYVEQLKHFVAVISGNAVPRVDAKDALETLRVTLAVYDAARTGQRVVLN